MRSSLVPLTDGLFQLIAGVFVCTDVWKSWRILWGIICCLECGNLAKSTACFVISDTKQSNSGEILL